ncbi:MAG: hypothetical protein PHH82_03710 [Candidatus ainarchaeum sp.]|nr:hypothetical protein [Candidatus ainarchaeum sp.]
MDKETQIVGVEHLHYNLPPAIKLLEESNAQTIGLEIPPKFLQVFEEIYKTSKNKTEKIRGLAELHLSEIDSIKEYMNRAKRQFRIPEQFIQMLIRVLDQHKIQERNAIDRLDERLESHLEYFITSRPEISTSLFFYSLFEKAKKAGKTVVPLESNNLDIMSKAYLGVLDAKGYGVTEDLGPLERLEIFLKKAQGPMRESHMAYQIAKHGVDLTFVGQGHVGVYGVQRILSKRGYKVKVQKLMKFYPMTELDTKYMPVRKDYAEKMKRTHDAWWNRLEQQRERQRQGLPAREKRFTKTRQKLL